MTEKNEQGQRQQTFFQNVEDTPLWVLNINQSKLDEWMERTGTPAVALSLATNKDDVVELEWIGIHEAVATELRINDVLSYDVDAKRALICRDVLESVAEGRVAEGNVTEGRIHEAVARELRINDVLSYDVDAKRALICRAVLGSVAEGSVAEGNVTEGRIHEAVARELRINDVLSYDVDAKRALICRDVLGSVAEGSVAEGNVTEGSAAEGIDIWFLISYSHDICRRIHEAVARELRDNDVLSCDVDAKRALICRDVLGSVAEGSVAEGNVTEGRIHEAVARELRINDVLSYDVDAKRALICRDVLGSVAEGSVAEGNVTEGSAAEGIDIWSGNVGERNAAIGFEKNEEEAGIDRVWPVLIGGLAILHAGRQTGIHVFHEKRRKYACIEDNGEEGSVAEGSVAEGSVAEGSVAEGSVAEGSVGEGSVAEGSVAEGNVTEGRIHEAVARELRINDVLSYDVDAKRALICRDVLGSVAEGSVAEGHVTEGSAAEGIDICTGIHEAVARELRINDVLSYDVDAKRALICRDVLGSVAEGSVAEGNVTEGRIHEAVARELRINDVLSYDVDAKRALICCDVLGSVAEGSVAEGNVTEGSAAEGIDIWSGNVGERNAAIGFEKNEEEAGIDRVWPVLIGGLAILHAGRQTGIHVFHEKFLIKSYTDEERIHEAVARELRINDVLSYDVDAKRALICRDVLGSVAEGSVAEGNVTEGSAAEGIDIWSGNVGERNAAIGFEKNEEEAGNDRVWPVLIGGNKPNCKFVVLVITMEKKFNQVFIIQAVQEFVEEVVTHLLKKWATHEEIPVILNIRITITR
eukprot:gene11223-21407_t